MSETAALYEVNGKIQSFEPLFDRVLIRPTHGESEKLGIIIPDQAKDKPQEGLVMAAGPGRMDEEGKLITMSVKAGDRVLYGKYAGTEIKLNDEDFLIMHQEDVLGILR